MFVDKVTISVKAGDGGKGVVSFRHEKFVDRGGPDGGDGGRGGDVIIVADRNQDTLAAFRHSKRVVAPDGTGGSKRKRHGKNGADLMVKVPVGTVAVASDGQVIADLVSDGQQAVIARGGQGGFGNAHFVSSVRQAPRVAEKGEPGEEKELTLELKMIADVGLVGLPNAGKSTLLSVISNARPEIADYPFTTLRPNLGVVDVGKTSLLVADIPGLIEGASRGKGLGDEFLRHVERTSVLLHLVDAYSNDVAASYRSIQKELQSYTVDLSKRPQLIVLSKIDGLDSEIVADLTQQLKKVAPKQTQILPISAKSGVGVSALLQEVTKQVEVARKKAADEQQSELPVLTFEEPEDHWTIKKSGDNFVVVGKKIESFARRTDFDDYFGSQRMRDILRKLGVINALVKQKIEPGQKIIIGDPKIGELEY